MFSPLSYRPRALRGRFFVLALCAWLLASAAQAATLNWGPVRTFTMTTLYGGIVVGAPDNSTGGFSFTTGAMTPYGNDADMVISNYGTIGALGVTLSQAPFTATSEADPGGYMASLRTRNVGDIYIIQLRNGRHAKIRIDSLPAGGSWYTYRSIGFSYMVEQTGATPTPTPASNPTYYVDCARQTLPGGVSCSASAAMDRAWSVTDVTAAIASMGCSDLGYGLYHCGTATSMPGHFITYIYTGTSSVSRIIYLH